MRRSIKTGAGILLLALLLPAALGADTITKVFNYPNPFKRADGTTTIVFKYNRVGANIDLTYYVYIYNLAGHRVLIKQRTVTGITAGLNTVEFTWNGHTDKGDACPPGVYYVRIVTDGSSGSVQSISRYGKLMIK